MFTLKYIPEEIFFDILARSPVKSLLRFQCVRRSWNTLITSPGFKQAHLERNSIKSGSDYLLFRGYIKSATLFNAETLSKLLDIQFPGGHETGSFSVRGSCYGLLCVFCHGGNTGAENSIYLWNPSIRKSKKLPEYLILEENKKSFCAGFGFGFHHQKNDYRAVRVAQFMDGDYKLEAEVYSLKLDSWRRISAVPPLASEVSWSKSAYLNGLVYWIISEFESPNKCILSFDLDSEIFQTIALPDTLRRERSFPPMTIRVFEKRLSVFRHSTDQHNSSWKSIWVLETDTWKMIRTIRLPKGGRIARPVGLTTDGVLILERGALCLYDPDCQQLKHIQVGLLEGVALADISVYSYMESLILLN